MTRGDGRAATAPAAPAGGLDWLRCRACGALVYGRRFVRDLQVCAKCGHHARIGAPQRLAMLLDGGSAVPLDVTPTAFDPLGFADTVAYPRRLADARERSGLDEAVVCARGTIDGRPVVVAAMDFRFMGGSLGCAAGELITVAAETALAMRAPLVLCTASGGARMQEGVLSLMQMAKVSQALSRLDEAGVLTVSVVTDPTYGGVAASFATQADVILAEPGARMGFAGPRVIEQTIMQELPAGFQTAEFLLERGLIDGIVARSALRSTLAQLARVHDRTPHPSPGRHPSPSWETDPDALPAQDAWSAVCLARHDERPTTLDYVYAAFDGFVVLRGDRHAADCPAVVGGVAWLDGAPVVVIGHQKGRGGHERVACNFGMASPEGCRKAARLMRLAAKLSLPVCTLIDTPGAHPGIAAEERGQALAIAENLRLMASLPVPIVAVITGEGGSGGALALAVGDRVYALANAIYSVISPEGCASILWRDAAHAPRAAAALHLGAPDLLRLGVVDAVLPEPRGGAHTDVSAAADVVRRTLRAALHELAAVDPARLVDERRRRYRGFGVQACVNPNLPA